MGIRNNRYKADVATGGERLGKLTSVHGDQARYLRAQTDRRIKFTPPGPMTIYDIVANAAYESRAIWRRLGSTSFSSTSPG